eukprot:1917648-Rhodomonas_salina.1
MSLALRLTQASRRAHASKARTQAESAPEPRAIGTQAQALRGHDRRARMPKRVSLWRSLAFSEPETVNTAGLAFVQGEFRYAALDLWWRVSQSESSRSQQHAIMIDQMPFVTSRCQVVFAMEFLLGGNPSPHPVRVIRTIIIIPESQSLGHGVFCRDSVTRRGRPNRLTQPTRS